MKAGVIVYRQGTGGLVGTWTHASLGGAVATEQVDGCMLDAPVGAWPVAIQTPEPMPLFKGMLTIAPFGPSLSLRWEGEVLEPLERPESLVVVTSWKRLQWPVGRKGHEQLGKPKPLGPLRHVQGLVAHADRADHRWLRF